jgi:hypothetical protein
METSVLQPLLDTSSLGTIPGFVCGAILDLNGQMLKGDLPPKDSAILFHMLVETGSLSLDQFRRITVTALRTRYVISRDDTHIYIIKALNVS